MLQLMSKILFKYSLRKHTRQNEMKVKRWGQRISTSYKVWEQLLVHEKDALMGCGMSMSL